MEGFRKSFTRNAAFNWFVVVVVGLMVRTDHPGVTSFIRDLGIRPGMYESLIYFFRATSWNILIGDGVKQSKEAHRMPGVKKLF